MFERLKQHRRIETAPEVTGAILAGFYPTLATSTQGKSSRPPLSDLGGFAQ
tara:strand:+ start:1337 stop:1489 length:153 start_codon:yes stop_codon:yes gene_type:complete